MTHLARSLHHPGLRIALIIGGALVSLLIILAAYRPEMMGSGMAMISRLIVGFGL